MKPVRGGIDIRKLNVEENAVSDTIGFILILAITIVSLAIIALFAQPILDKTKDEISFSNMEQAFILLHSDINDIGSGKSTIKTSDMNLMNAQLVFNPNSTNITISTESHEPITFNAGSIEYDINGLKVCLENGALISYYRNGSFIIREPFIFTTNDGQVTIINLIKLDGPDFSIGGEGIVRIIEQKNFSESYIPGQQKNISITIESPYADGWAHYFEKQGFDTVIPCPNTVIANITGTEPRIFGTAVRISQGKALPVNRPEYSLTAVINTPSGTIEQPDLQVNATITNNGNQDMSNVTARLDYFSFQNYSITQPATIGDLCVGSSHVVNWNVSTFSNFNDAEFTVTVEGTGTSSWIHPAEYQVRSNKIWVARVNTGKAL